MSTRQAILIMTYFTLLLGLSACSASNHIISNQTVTSPPPIPSPVGTATVTLTPSPIPPTSTPTPLTCLTQPGAIKQDVVRYTNPPQEFLIYLPPCYGELNDLNYPVLYLLNGQTYTQDQWVRLGAPNIADQLIHSGESVSFMIVFPDDRFWNLQAGAGFGDRFIRDLIPYVDQNYRTIPDRAHRSLGGLSRGGGWVVKLGFEYPELFGSLGLHSPAIFKEDAPYVEKNFKNIPEENRPRLWLDVGDADRELASILRFEEMLTRNNYIHEYYFYAGDHTEIYWGAHVQEYLRWYAQAWQAEPAE